VSDSIFHRRRLPHYQPENKVLFVSFRAYFELTPQVRTLVLQACLHEHERRIRLHAAVIMPDHVHLCFALLRDPKTKLNYRLEAVIQAIKSVSSRQAVKIMDIPFLWQEEYFDRALRNFDKLDAAMEYIRQNPVKAKLVASPEAYRWLWTSMDYKM
jgi:REP element-mobilizing transposase RayT